MNMEIVIREALRKDCPRMLELVRGLAEYEKAPQEVTIAPDHFADSGFGPKPVWWGYVAEAEGQVVGFALWYIRFSTWKGQRLYLEDIYVEPEWRGRGIGAMLFERVMEEGRRRGFSGMMWQVLDWNEPALNFYRKYGARFDGEWINASVDF